MEYAASSGVAKAGLATGIIGTTLGVLNGGMGNWGGWGGWGGRGYGYGGYSTFPYEIEHRIDDVERMGDKDAMIAALQAEKYADRNGIELYKQFRADLKDALAPLVSDIKELQHEAREQAVYNGVNNAQVTLLRSQVNELLALTQRIIPNASVVPGWVSSPAPNT